MPIDRRMMLQAGAAAALTGALPSRLRAQNAFAPSPGAWRGYEVKTRLEIAEPSGTVQAWIPLPSVTEDDWMRAGGSLWRTNGVARLRRDPKYGAEILHVTWPAPAAPAGPDAPVVEVVSQVLTRDRAIDVARPGAVRPLDAAERRLYLEGTELIPVDGIVKATSDRIVAGATGDLAKARAIYEWVVTNTFRDAATRGCGSGDIAAMLKSGNLGGKCADLNALYVGLARAAGLPARDVYGLRVAPSRFGYRSLGAGSEVVTKAQHCRAEVYLEGVGWTPVDPADVRKVALEEPPANLALDHPKVAAARGTLFGAWEGNWLAYNFAHDVALPGAAGPTLGFLMYPQAEVAGLRLDCLDPDRFRYAITARSLDAA